MIRAKYGSWANASIPAGTSGARLPLAANRVRSDEFRGREIPHYLFEARYMQLLCQVSCPVSMKMPNLSPSAGYLAASQ